MDELPAQFLGMSQPDAVGGPFDFMIFAAWQQVRELLGWPIRSDIMAGIDKYRRHGQLRQFSKQQRTANERIPCLVAESVNVCIGDEYFATVVFAIAFKIPVVGFAPIPIVNDASAGNANYAQNILWISDGIGKRNTRPCRVSNEHDALEIVSPSNELYILYCRVQVITTIPIRPTTAPRFESDDLTKVLDQSGN